MSNWDGVCFKIPKPRFSDSASLPEIKNTGIYFLIGNDLDGTDIYVGEGENLYKRIEQHMGEDTWQEAYIVTRKGNGLNKAHAKYLEHYFYQKAIETKYYKVLNKSIPTKSSLSVFDAEDMKEFIYYTTMLVDFLGCGAFIATAEKQSISGDLYIESVGIKAHGKMLDNEFVVLKGSQSRTEFKKASSNSLRRKWEQLRTDRTIINDHFAKDCSFPSPSTAAAVVLGRNANGLSEWKNADGVTLKDILSK